VTQGRAGTQGGQGTVPSVTPVVTILGVPGTGTGRRRPGVKLLVQIL
jgi:hypothetical protein